MASLDMRFDPDRPDYGQFSDIYLDETSQTKHRFLLIGGLIVPTHAAALFEGMMRVARVPELPHGEMAWIKVSRTKLAAYRRVVSMFFRNDLGLSHLDFHCLAVNTSQQDHREFNEGSREIGFNKEIYQLGMKFGRLYRHRLFHCYPDKRSTKSSPEELRLILNRGIRKKGDNRDWPYRRVHFRESAESQALQLVDILLGAVAYRLNGHREAPGASPAKCELSDYVLWRAGIQDVTVDTALSGRFTVWHRVLRKASRGPRPPRSPS